MPPLMTCTEIRDQLTRTSINLIQEMRQPSRTWLYDKNWENPKLLINIADMSAEERMNDTGEGSILLSNNNKYRDWLLEDLEDEEDLHVRIDVAGWRWTGKGATITEREDEKGVGTIELKFLHEYEHVKKAVCFCNPLLPAELQIPKLFALAGPTVFGISTLLFLNLMRRFALPWTLSDNIFDPATWLANLFPENWPIVVLPVDFLTDQSMWSITSTRMGMAHDVAAPTLSDAQCQIVPLRWFPGDPQPAPDHMTLTKSTLTLGVRDVSGYRGLTGTVLDGLINFTTSVADDLLNEVVTEVTGAPNPPEYSIAGFLGTVPQRPWVAWRNAQRTGLSGIGAWQTTVHKALAGAIVTGGHSPDWVNSGLKLLANSILGYIGEIFLNPGLTLGIFDQALSDVVLAFDRVPNPLRQTRMGNNSYGEYWESTGGTGFSLSALQAVRAGFDRTKGYRSYKATVINGAPYWVGRHFSCGDRVAAEVGRKGNYWMDHVYAVKYGESRTKNPHFDISIGQDAAEQQPGAMLARQVAQLKNITQMIGVSS